MVKFDASPEAVKARYYTYLSRDGDDYEFQLMTIMAEDMFHALKEEMEQHERMGHEFKYRADDIRELIEPLLKAGGSNHP